MFKRKSKLKRIIAFMMAISLAQNPSVNYAQLAMAQEVNTVQTTPSDASYEETTESGDLPTTEAIENEKENDDRNKAGEKPESIIYNGATSLLLSDDKKIIANELYNTKLQLNVTRSASDEADQGKILEYYYVSVADKETAERDNADIEWIKYYDVTNNKYSNIPIPGDYYIAYETENELYGYFDFGVTIEKVGIEKPASVTWNGNSVTWDAVTKSQNGVNIDSDVNLVYEVTLYKNEKKVTSKETEETSVDFSEYFSGINYGDYTVGVIAKVKGTVGTNRYTDSYEAKSAGNNYKDTVAPVVESIGVGTGELAGKIVVTATDNLAVTDYIFTTSADKPAVDDNAWKKVTSSMTSDGLTNIYASADGEDDFKLSSAGLYYVYVKDAQGNIAGSTENVAVSEIDLYAEFSDGTVDLEKATKSVVLVGTEDTTAIAAANSQSGYNFEGWFADYATYENGPVKAIKVSNTETSAKVMDIDGVNTLVVPAATKASLYAKYSGQTYIVSATADEVNKTYDGTLDGSGITITGQLGECDYSSIAYSWQRKSENNGETVWTEVSTGTTTVDNDFENKFVVQNVSDSGTYRVVATINVNGQNKQAISNEVTVTINKKKIKLFISSITNGISYGDMVPTMDSEGVKLSYDLESTKNQQNGFAASDDLYELIAANELTLGTLKTTYNPENTNSSGQGSYDIVEDVETVADNYVFDVVKGTLTVGAKNVEAENSNVKLYIKDATAENGITDDYHSIYIGSAIEPVVVAYDGENEIPVSNYSYVDGYANNIHASTDSLKASVTVNFTGNYTGSLTIDFTIDQKEYKPIVKMRKIADSAVIDAGENAAIYGDNIEAFLEDNEAGSKPEYYYAAFSGETAPDFSNATKSIPENAGKYYVWAKMPATDDYVEVITDPYEFAIEKRVITLTAKSYSWTYDGKVHLGETDSNGYIQVGELVGSDSFKSIKVSGSITDVGEVDNEITYELTPVAETHKDNYDIIPINGKLVVTKCLLEAPSDFDWTTDYNYPGRLEWTPVSKSGLKVNYTIRLYKQSVDDELIFEQTTDEDNMDLTRVIRHDALDNGVAGYYATITVNPVEEDDSNHKNYDVSGESNPTSVKNTMEVNITKDDASIKSIRYGLYGDGDIVSGDKRVYIDNEYIYIIAAEKSGYDKPNFTCIQAAGSANDVSTSIYGVNNSEYIYQRVKLNQSGAVVINATADDSKPIIKTFSFTNDPSSNYEKVNVKIVAYDEIGLDGYAVIEAKSAADALKQKNITYTSFDGATVDANKNTSINMTVDKEGTYYLLVRDTKGNVTVCSDDVAKTINVISFANGKVSLDDANLFGGEMKPCYKVSGTSLTLPENKFTKIGYTFKDWAFKYEDSAEDVISDGVLSDMASYAANKNVKLTAQWSDKQYKYKVLYYYMDVDGTYPEEPSETKEYTGGYEAVISNNTTTIRLEKIGFTFDDDSSFYNEVTLVDQNENYNVRVYYKRNKYELLYSYTDPVSGDLVSTYNDNGQEKSISQSYYYGEEIKQLTIQDVAQLTGIDLTGYTFAGWNYTDYDNSQNKMPAKDIHAEGVFSADKVEVRVNYYIQELPIITGSIAGDDYSETKSDNYKIYQSVTYSYNQGDDIYETISSSKVKKIEGFKIRSVVISKGAGYGSAAPAVETTTASGKASATTYINFYYTRDTYKVTLNVYKDQRDVDANIMYSKTWENVSYGVNLADTTIGSVEKNQSASEAMATYGYSEDDTKNVWIADYMNGSTRKDSFKSYILATYTGWSSGSAPETMPAGNVAITKEYIKKTTAAYKVEFYLQTIDNNEVVYKAEPTYSIYKYETVNNTIHAQASDKDAEDTDVYINYNSILRMLDKSSDSYIYDTSPIDSNGNIITPITYGIVQDDDPETEIDESLTLKLYFKRAKVATRVTYQYVDKTGLSTDIASYDVWAQWGTTIDIRPTEYFYGDGNDMSGTDASKSVYKKAPEDGTIYTAAKVNDTLIAKNYNDALCEISYSGYYYLANVGGNWPRKLFTKESEIYDSENNTYKDIKFNVGQRGRDSSTGNYADLYNRITITYSELDVTKSYYMQLSWNAYSGAAYQNQERFVVEGDGTYCQIAKVLTGYEDDENHTPKYEYQKWYVEDGTRTYTVVDETTYNNATAFNIRVANKRDIYNSEMLGDDQNSSKYKVERMLENNSAKTDEESDSDMGISYVYKGVDTDHFKEITCITKYGKDSYYLGMNGTTGANNIYMVNNKNNQFVGNYVIVNTESADCENKARLGKTDADSRVTYGHYLAHETTYRHSVNINSNDPWLNQVDYYDYYQNVQDNKVVTLTFNGNVDKQSFDYGAIYSNPYNDTRAAEVFKIDDGYRIVWYEDSAYTKPVDVEKTYKMEVDRSFFGRREKALLDNFTYASYELSNKNLKDSALVGMAKKSHDNDSGMDRYYIDDSNYGLIDWAEITDESELAETGNYVITSIVTKKYQDDQFLNEQEEAVGYREVEYKAQRFTYYINGELVLIKDQTSAPTFSAVNLEYTDDLYLLSGFKYDEKNIANKVAGYCQKTAIKLNAYYYRQTYIEHLTYPGEEDKNHTYYTEYDMKYQAPVTIKSVDKNGYEFVGWNIYSYTHSVDENGHVIGNRGAKYNQSKLDSINYHLEIEDGQGTAKFNMPAEDIYISPVYKEAGFEYDILYYFQEQGGSYANGLMDSVLLAEKNEFEKNVAITFANSSTEQSKAIYSDSSESELLALKFTYNGDVYYFNAAEPSVKENGEGYVVTASSLIAAKRTIDADDVSEGGFETGSNYKVSDYVLDVSQFEIFDFSYASYQYDSVIKSYQVADSSFDNMTFTADADMTIAYYYTRTSKYRVRITSIAGDATKDNQSPATGLTLKGDATGLYYGQEVTLSAVVADGYRFKGWYKASDVLPEEYHGFDANVDLETFKYIDADKLAQATKISPDIVDGQIIDTQVTVSVTNNEDYVAISEPMTFTGESSVTVTITAGRTDYVYGYADSGNNYLTAKVEIPEEDRKNVKVTGYQWYRVNAIDGMPTSENIIEDATSYHFAIDKGLDAKNYYYQCVVSLERTDNGRKTSVMAAQAQTLVVRKYGSDGKEPSEENYISVNSYTTSYDGAEHTISINVANIADNIAYENGTRALADVRYPDKFELYVSTKPMNSWDDVVEQVADGIAFKSDTTEATGISTVVKVPNQFYYKNVKLDSNNQPDKYTLYYYLRTEDENLSPNYADKFGSSYVNINQRLLALTRGNVFAKVYNGDANISGDVLEEVLDGANHTDLYRLANGEENGIKYFVVNDDTYKSEEDNFVIGLDAKYIDESQAAAKDVDRAKSILVSNVAVLYNKDVTIDGIDHVANEINYNYTFADNYTTTLAGFIEPYPLQLVWSEDDYFLYDGKEHAVEAVLKDGCTPPDSDVSIKSKGAQKNVGTYEATAYIDDKDKPYTAADYSLDIEAKEYTIAELPIKIRPVKTTKTYNGQVQNIDAFEITVKDLEEYKPISSNGKNAYFEEDQYIVMNTLSTDTGAKAVGDHTVKAIQNPKLKIYDRNNADITYNFDISLETNTLTITEGLVTISNALANDKIYDGTTEATLKTKKVVIGNKEVEVLDGVILEGKQKDDVVYVKADAVTNVNFVESSVGTHKVTFEIANKEDALCGANANQYMLDTSSSDMTSSATITAKTITVSINSLSEGVTYGITPNYGVTYSGFENGEDESVISGHPIFLLDDNVKDEIAAVNYETDDYKYNYTVKDSDNNDVIIKGTKIPVNENGYVITLEKEGKYVKGLSADNYVFVFSLLQDPDVQTALPVGYAKLNVLPREVTISGLNRPDGGIGKTYDGTTAVNTEFVLGTDYEFVQETPTTGVIAGDEFGIDYNAAYNSEKVKVASSITADSVSIKENSNDQSRNYSLTNDTFTVKGKINPKDLNVLVEDKTITYGDEVPVYTAKVDGFVGKDTVIISSDDEDQIMKFTCDYVNDKASDNRKAGTYDIVVSDLTDTNYNLVLVNDANPEGTLTVDKKKITVGVVGDEDSNGIKNGNPITIIYGKQSVPSTYSYYTSGWIEAYDEESEVMNSVALVPAGKSETIDEGISIALESAEDNDYVYKENGYAIYLKMYGLTSCESENYKLVAQDGVLNVRRQFISVCGIETSPKVYDGKTDAKPKFDPENVIFTCYFSGVKTQSTYKAVDLIPASELEGLSPDQKQEYIESWLEDNLVVEATYQDTGDIKAKDVGKNKNVSLDVSLKEGSYLYGRFELIKTEEDMAHTDIADAKVTQSSTTDGEITRRQLWMMVYYGDAENSSLAYGEMPNQDDFGYKFISNTSLVEGETLASAGIVLTDDGKPIYKIVKNTPSGFVDYSPTSGVGKYYIKLDEDTIVYETNYLLKVYGTNIDINDNCKVEVVKNTLKTPAPVWDEENPGTVKFKKTEKIGNVDVDKYEIKLYRNDELVQTDTVNRAGETEYYSKDYATVIRNAGPGKYTVSVKAIAETNEFNPVGDERNVEDSLEGMSNDTYAVYVDVKYATDTVTGNAATKVAENADKNTGKDSSSVITVAGIKKQATSNPATYPEEGSAYTARNLVISGESATVEMSWYDKNGYTTGYELAATPWTIKKGDSQTTDVEIVSGSSIDNSATGVTSTNPSYKTDIKASLTSADTITMSLSLAEREVASTFTVDPVRYEATFGYKEGEEPLYNTTLDCSNDNIGEADYKLTYKWEYRKGTTWSILKDYAGEENVATMKVPFGEKGFAAYNYKIRCTLILERKDNTKSKTIRVTTCKINDVSQDIPMTIKKAVVDGNDIVAIADDWIYGEAVSKSNSDNTGSLRLAVKTNGKIPVGDAGIGVITYYFSQDKENWTKWTTDNHPENAGTYYLYADVAASDNYDKFTTTGYNGELYTSFKVLPNKLQYVADQDQASGMHLFSTDDLAMASSKKAPYGLAKWPTVITPKENIASTTNYITATYKVSLYRKADGESSFTKIKQYDTSDVTVLNGICSVDMAADMNAKGTYYYTVKAISSNKSNCEDSDLIQSKLYEVFDNIKVTDSDGNEITYSGNELEYTYNAKDVTLSVAYVSESSYQWYIKDQPIENATTNSIKVRYVEDSDVYSCKVTSNNGNTVDSNHLSLTIKPKTITLVSGTEARVYDGTPLTEDKWWIGEDASSEETATAAVSIATASGTKKLTEKSTGNTVTGVNVTGTITYVLYGTDKTTVVGADNTLIASGVIITEPASAKVVYDSEMVAANTANYIIKTTPGKLTVNPLPITIKSGSNTWVYDTTKHTEHSYTVSSGALAVDDAIAADGGVLYTGEITDVAYSDGVDSEIISVNNTFDKVVIKNAEGTDITTSYKISKEYGKLKVTPRGEIAENEADKADFNMVLTVGGQTSEDNKYENTGSEIAPKLTITDLSTNIPDGTVLEYGKDYVFETDSQNEENGYGSYTMKVKFIGNYKGSKSVSWSIEDVVAPTGEIKVGSFKWNGFAEDITYDIYERFTVDITITAKDEIGGSGIKSVKYFVYEKPNEASNGLTENAVKNLEDSDWISIENGGSFEVSPTRDIVVYARIEDNVGHVTYISSNGLVLEDVPPVIENISTGKVYCIEQKMKVTDIHLDTVEVVGKSTNGGILSSGKVTLDSNNEFTLLPVNGETTVYEVTAKDKAGNTSVISNVTINPVHTWKYNGDGTNKVSVICDIDTCEYHEAENLSAEIKIESGDYTGKAYVATVERSEDYSELQVQNQKASIGTISAVTYYRLAAENAGQTTGGTKLTLAPVDAGYYYAEAEITCQEKKYHIRKAFSIAKVNIDALIIMPTDLIYNGNEVGPTIVTVTATVDGQEKILKKGTEYEVVSDATNNILPSAKNVGTYTYKVKGIGNYKGTLEKTYTIRDDQNPVVTGITENGHYCISASLKIEDPNLAKVTITRTVNVGGNEEEETIVDETMSGSSYENTLTGAADGTKYTITAVDLSDNTVVRHITVYENHLFEDANYVAQDDGTTIMAPCSHLCGAVDTETIRFGTIEWNYNYSYSVPDSSEPETGVQGEAARATYAYIQLYQDNVLIATRMVDCDDQCGVGGSSTNGIGTDSFEFRKYNPTNPTAAENDCHEYIPLKDSAGNPYSYYLKAVIAKKNADGSYSIVNDYAITESEDYEDVNVGHHFEVSYNPGCFDINWNVILDELPNADGTHIKPDALYVKVLFAYSENATDEENANGYQTISQQTGVHDLGVLCTPVDNGDGTYTYSGKYPVWKYQGGTTDSYYHRIQVVGYMYNGVRYDVESKKYKSINDLDHEKHTIYYVHETGEASGVVEYIMSNIPLPVVAFDYNEGDDTTNIATRSISIIKKESFGEAVTEDEIAEATTSRDNYEFLGWYDKPVGGSRITSIESLDHSWQLYAHWKELVTPSMEISVTGKKNGSQDVSIETSDEVITPCSFQNYYDGIPEIAIVAEDTDRGTGVVNSGVASIKYYVSRTELTTEALDILPQFAWKSYEGAFDLTDFDADKDVASDVEGDYVVYALVEDNEGNYTYASTDGITVDMETPEISGVLDGHNYCEQQIITVTDKYLDKVVINGEVVELDSDGKYILKADGTTYHIVATDKAGHSTEVTVVVYSGHEYGEPIFEWNDDYTGGTETYICKHDPTHIKTVVVDGEIKTEVRAKNDVPEVNVANLTKELAKEIFGIMHPDESGAGKKILLFLEIMNAKDLVTTQEKMLVENKIQDIKDAVVAMYLDISLYLQVNDNKPEKLSNTSGNLLGFNIKIPEEFINTDSNIKRTYSIVRVHNGKAEILESKYDSENETIAFETDKFSIYALCYYDQIISEEDTTEGSEASTSEQTTTEQTTSEEPTNDKQSDTNREKAVDTGDDMPIVWLFVVMMISGMGICVIKKRKENNVKLVN